MRDKMIGKVSKTLQNDWLVAYIHWNGKIHWNDKHGVIIDAVDQNSPST